ncbi:hypothetical protein Osc7112_5140 [Oscillatoria nigro-viridis PCC 7112]|uniref:RAMA domain-containing protein n=1 Tax=Phormidium nigroviride PCC 7112 TaxID=179408 RepID=K9VMR9_9CYAN|nr:hypothetical protein [Oscillatoria nigro-viridis]AFZ09398.1 hypothetical protein Osc7112_5140 [Oscillatoria nigro-viridis PCC 7112]
MYIPVTFDHSGIQRNEAIEIKVRNFKDLNLQERHIEEFLRKNINLLFGDDQTLLVVGQQVRNASNGISDLTAIDADGNIVLIEIKRDEQDIKARKEPFESQAIRYAASYAKISTPESLVELVYSSYIDIHKDEYELGDLTPSEKARRELNKFLSSNDALKTFNKKQRIILIASSFDEQTLSAVAWLIANGVDAICLKITPVFIGEQGFLRIEKLLPPPQLDDFYVGLAGECSTIKEEIISTDSGFNRTWLPRMDQLFEWELIKAGDSIEIKYFESSEAIIVDPTFVVFNGEEISYNNWGKKVTGWSSISIYEWAVLSSTNRTLHELRKEKMAELEAKGSPWEE